MELLLVALFGAAGCVFRYVFSGFVYQIAGTYFPFGTLAVNVVGSFLVGVLMQAGTSLFLLPSEMRTAAAIGFLGGFTTFSTFSFETFKLLEEGSLGLAGVNVACNLFACLLAVYGGIMMVRVMS